MNLYNLGNDEIEEIFTEAYREMIADPNGIVDFEVNINRGVGGDKIKAEVSVMGYAGTPTIDKYKSKTLKNINSLKVVREDLGACIFKYLDTETVPLSGIDYIVVYEEV